MPSISFSLVVSSICFAGMAALSLAMDRHYEQVLGRFCVPRWHRIALRVLGALLLFLSLWVCMAGSGISFSCCVAAPARHETGVSSRRAQRSPQGTRGTGSARPLGAPPSKPKAPERGEPRSGLGGVSLQRGCSDLDRLANSKRFGCGLVVDLRPARGAHRCAPGGVGGSGGACSLREQRGSAWLILCFRWRS